MYTYQVLETDFGRTWRTKEDQEGRGGGRARVTRDLQKKKTLIYFLSQTHTPTPTPTPVHIPTPTPTPAHIPTLKNTHCMLKFMHITMHYKILVLFIYFHKGISLMTYLFSFYIGLSACARLNLTY